MIKSPVSMQLVPLQGGAYTRLRLNAFVPTPLPGWVLRKLCTLLTLFGGDRVQFALYVDKAAAPWCELWTESIAEVPERLVRVRYRSEQSGQSHEQ